MLRLKEVFAAAIDAIRHFGHRLHRIDANMPNLKDLRFHHIDAIIARARVKRLDSKGRAIGGIEAARKLRKELRRLLAYAVKLEWIAVNPVDHADTVKVAAGERSTGFHSWTEGEIAQYRTRWPLGTKQRLAMELMLWTGQRKCDVIHLGPQHINGGKFELRQSKTGKTLTLPIAPQLMAAIKAMPSASGLCFILTEWGRPFSTKGFGGWFRDQCNAAGLPHCTAHGLRKAAMRRMAERRLPNATLKAVSGHAKDDEVARYVQAADQERLASDAIQQISDWEMSNRPTALDTKSAQGAENE